MSVQRFGRYEIKAELGRGGMATVYHAFDPRFKRDVALKVLPREFLHDPTFRARFEHEAQIIAALEHSAIVPVYDFGEEESQPYLVMRFMTGGSLADRMKRGALPLTEIATIFSRLASALDEAHRRDIIHRDLKPGNILFDSQGEAHLSDFGIAKLIEATTTFTGTGIVGTPAYMSPEQARGRKDIDGRSDIYSLGVILFELLTGQPPYESDTPMGLAMAHLTEPVPDILTVKPDLPSAADTLIRRAMAKNRDERFRTAGELARATGEIVAGRVEAPVVSEAATILEPRLPAEIVAETPPPEAITPPPTAAPIVPPPTALPPPPTRAPKRSRSPWAALAVGSLLIGIVVVVGVFAFPQLTEGLAQIPGEYSVPDEGRSHIQVGQAGNYSHYPPSSGQHYAKILQWGSYQDEVQPEYYVHNLEHGGIVILYNCPTACPDTESALSELLSSAPPEDTFNEVKLIVSPNSSITSPVVAVAWGWQLDLPTVDVDLLLAFYQRHVNQGPELAP